MATHTQLTLNLGETWTIECQLNFKGGRLVIPEDAVVEWTLADNTGVVIRRTNENGILVTNAQLGECTIIVPPSMQTALNSGKPYTHELAVLFSDNTIMIQSNGPAKLSATTKSRFPGAIT